MKKSLVLIVFFLITSSIADGFAASPVEFQGYLKVYHETLSNFLRKSRAPYDRDNFFHNKLQIKVTFQPNDHSKVVWQFRGPSLTRWGTGDYHLFTRGLYGELNLDWGTIRLGRILDGMPGVIGGLASLGYEPVWGREYIYHSVFDYNTPVDAITYGNIWELASGNTIGLTIFYNKMSSNIDFSPRRLITGNYPVLFPYSPPVPVAESPFPKDIDYDLVGFDATYSWEGGGVSFGVEYDRNLSDPAVKDDYAVFFNPAFYQSWGKLSLHFEGKLGFGKRKYDKDFVDPALWKEFEDDYLGRGWDGTLKNKGLGLYLDAVYDYGKGNITLAAWYVSGSNTSGSRDSLNSLVDLGDFAPFLVAYNGQAKGAGAFKDVLGERWLTLNVPGDFDFTSFNSGVRNHLAVGILGLHHLVPDKVKMNYGLGYFRLNEPAMLWMEDGGGYRPVAFRPKGSIQNFREQSKDLGFELDLGFTFQIMERVYLETQLGYFWNGSAFDYYNQETRAWESPKGTFNWSNMLAFHF